MKIDTKAVRIMRTWGLSLEKYEQLLKKYGYTPFTTFHAHRAKARQRNVLFKMNFEQWWAVWDASGKWRQKGTHRGGYVMTRILDRGAYELGNVIIRTNRENADEYNNVTKHLRRMRTIVSDLARGCGASR